MQNLAQIINLLIIIISALLAIAIYTLRERKFLGYIQYRKGPNKPNIMALIIPMADAIKLLLKEQKFSILVNIKYFFLAPRIIIITALLIWPLFAHWYQSFFLKFSILYFLCITRINIYATFIAGWGSKSKWRLLGALRGIAQTISYEVVLSLIMICFIIYPNSINILIIIQNQYSWIILIILPLFISWIISILAETHRAPFDFTEGESELVSGFNIEYNRSIFAIIFMAEYINIILIRIVRILILSRNYLNTEIILKTCILSTIFIWTRGALPRLRYDSLINILWKKILPLRLLFIIITISLITLLN